MRWFVYALGLFVLYVVLRIRRGRKIIQEIMQGAMLGFEWGTSGKDTLARASFLGLEYKGGDPNAAEAMYYGTFPYFADGGAIYTFSFPYGTLAGILVSLRQTTYEHAIHVCEQKYGTPWRKDTTAVCWVFDKTMVIVLQGAQHFLHVRYAFLDEPLLGVTIGAPIEDVYNALIADITRIDCELNVCNAA